MLFSKWWYRRVQEHSGESRWRPCWCFDWEGRQRQYFRQFIILFLGRQSVRQTCLRSKCCWFRDAFFKFESPRFQGNHQPVTVSNENSNLSRMSPPWFYNSYFSEANYEVFRNEKGVNVGIKDANKLSRYGCYCLPTDLQAGHFLHGTPVDPIDNLCKDGIQKGKLIRGSEFI